MMDGVKMQFAFVVGQTEKAMQLRVGDTVQWVPKGWVQFEQDEEGRPIQYLPPGFALKKFGLDATLRIESEKGEDAEIAEEWQDLDGQYVPDEMTHEDYRVRTELDAIAPDAALLIACAISAAKTAELVISKCDPEFIASLTATLFINETKKRHGERY